MKFRYNGDEMSEVFGLQWIKGTVHDVTDAHAIKKLSHHHMFAVVEQAETKPGKAKKPGAEAAE